jgi:hypothetical protein
VIAANSVTDVTDGPVRDRFYDVMRANAVRPITYRFCGSILASNFPGILPGDRLFGRLRHTCPFAGEGATMPGRCFADAGGFVDAVVGAVQLLSSGAFDIRMLDGPAMLRLALTARRASPGEALISVGAAMLVSSFRPAEPAAAVLQTGQFVTRSFTLESAEAPGVAKGTLDTLYPIENAAA